MCLLVPIPGPAVLSDWDSVNYYAIVTALSRGCGRTGRGAVCLSDCRRHCQKKPYQSHLQDERIDSFGLFHWSCPHCPDFLLMCSRVLLKLFPTPFDGANGLLVGVTGMFIWLGRELPEFKKSLAFCLKPF